MISLVVILTTAIPARSSVTVPSKATKSKIVVIRKVEHHVAPTDATSVNTTDWICIRFHESTNGKLSNNIYQFQDPRLMGEIGMTRPAGTYTRTEQNEFALKAYVVGERYWHNGLHAWMADATTCHLPGF